MISAKYQFGKQQSASRSKRGEATAKPGTENRRTHDARPKTLNTQQETYDPRGPNPRKPSFSSAQLSEAKPQRSLTPFLF